MCRVGEHSDVREESCRVSEHSDVIEGAVGLVRSEW